MKPWQLALLLVVLLCYVVGVPKDHKTPPPPFRASLHADCDLGVEANHWFAAVDRISATHTRLVFTSVDGKKPASVFTVPGVLENFEEVNTALVLTFGDPGPTTRAFTEVKGRIQQVFECTSRFGALAFPLVEGKQTHRHCLACLQGEQMVGRNWEPTVAKLYVYTGTGYALDAEIPFSELYGRLAHID